MIDRYFNNAGAGIMSENTLSVVTRHMQREMEIGAYEAANEAKATIDGFYQSISKLLCANSANNIAFCESASRGWNVVVNGLNLHEGDRITTLSSEYGTNLIVLYDYARKHGVTLDVIPCAGDGSFDMGDLATSLQSGAKVVAMSHVSAHGSIVNPVYEVGSMCESNGVVFLVDGCQAVGQMPVDVSRMKCDAYVASGRKWLRGPRGTGFTFAKNNAKLSFSHLDLASADLELKAGEIAGISVVESAKRFELWEKSISSLIGLKNAVDEYLDGSAEAISRLIQAKANRIRQAVVANGKLCLVGSMESCSGVAAFYCTDPNDESAMIDAMTKAGVYFSMMKDWDCPLHFPKNGVKSILRLSPHYYTKDDDIDLVCTILGEQ